MSKDVISVALEPRTITGKSVKHLRSEGVVPAVIHNHGKPSLVMQGDVRELTKAYKQAGKHHPVIVTADGKKYTTMIKTMELEPRKQQLVHVVFNAVNANQTVEAEIPIHPRYAEDNDQSPAERNNLIVIANLEVVNVKALPNNLPDALYYDAEKLVEVGDHVTVADLDVPADIEIDAEPEQTLATVYEPSAIAAANDAAGGDVEDEDAADVPADQGTVASTESEAAQATAKNDEA